MVLKLLVTGGAGFIGSHIVEQLIANQHQVVVLDDLSTGDRNNLPNDVRLVIQDVAANLDDLFAAERFDAVIHHAAQVSVPHSIEDPIRDLHVNLQGMLSVLEACRKHQVGKVVFASSAAVYGTPQTLPIPEDHPLTPLSPYGITKKSAEEYLRIYHELHGIRYTILRYGNVYGPRQSVKGESGVIAIFTDARCKGRIPTIFGDGYDTRDYVYVEDVARANLLALTQGDGEILNISTETAVNLRELFATLDDVLNEHEQPRFGPPRPGDIQHSTLQNDKAAQVLGWKPQTVFYEGLKQTVKWVKQHG
jgi:UDP-glucose 4-epimerase